ncbi:MAG: AI-2E family transporter [Simplicispira sp.]|nr:AI-2E family transporter [Simplicispira sp.]
MPWLGTPSAPKGVRISSYVLMAGALLLFLWQGLLPGVLFACLGFALTRWLARQLARVPREPVAAPRLPRWTQITAATLVVLAPLVLLLLGLSHSRGYVSEAPQQYRELLDYLARTVLELRLKLPPDMAALLPEGTAEIQRTLASYLGAKAGALALAGRAWLGGVLHAYVGLLIGALAAVRPVLETQRPLAQQLHLRITRFGEAFSQIVAAQCWIATFNTLLTAVFLLGVLPLSGMPLPYTPALITLTFVAGLIPIVGNLVCNAVITIVGLSVSPAAAAACLGFLMVIHKAEYVINAKVVGQRTHMGVWELLAVMFVAEAIFGAAGLVAAPLFYAYLKKELFAARLV